MEFWKYVAEKYWLAYGKSYGEAFGPGSHPVSVMAYRRRLARGAASIFQWVRPSNPPSVRDLQSAPSTRFSEQTVGS